MKEVRQLATDSHQDPKPPGFSVALDNDLPNLFCAPNLKEIHLCSAYVNIYIKDFGTKYSTL